MRRHTELRPGARFPTELRLTESRDRRDWLAFAGAVAIALALGIFFGATLALWWTQ